MTRFVAFVWDERDAEALAQASMIRQSLIDAQGWVCVTDRAQLALYMPHPSVARTPPIHLYQEAGIILGTLFNRAAYADHGTEPLRLITEHETREIVRTQGRSVIDRHFGSYVLFLRHPEEHRISIVRGPLGTLACYYLIHRRLTILVSHTADLQWLSPGSLSINWDSIRAQAAAGDYLTRETGLSAVTAMISGECLDIHEGRATHRSYWSPSHHCVDRIASLPEAADLLRRETQSCVGAWARSHDTILLLLSGGLDSSIVLSCLRRTTAHARVIAVNFYSDGAGDERRFARCMAAHAQTPLEEIASNLHIDLRQLPPCALTASPVLNFTAFDVEPVMRGLAQHWNATALFTGEGGDDVLGHASMSEALAELLQHPRRMHRLFGASLDYAELTRISVWRALRLALHPLPWRRAPSWSVYRHRQLTGHGRASSLLTDAAAAQYETMIDRFVHPWFNDARALPLGKTMLVYSIIKATSSVSRSPFDDANEYSMISPLMSQPLIEAALRIPSDLHFFGAQNGAVARAAFRADLCPEVLERGTAKGTPASWARSLLDHNAAFLKTLLLEGHLARAGILDRTKLNALLSQEVSRSRIGIAELIRQLYIELWLRRWADAGVRS
jgi:asparagine synthase (glutamine-hydrolysing)